MTLTKQEIDNAELRELYAKLFTVKDQIGIMEKRKAKLETRIKEIESKI